ncbi:MAG: hypothetical protein K2X87_11415 [Gemmataceae bacterium]|nr:hypothetical protein [Gemmataceae bacterium]
MLVAGSQPVPDYLAPDQVRERAESPPSPATDLHAVGVMLYQMLTGDLPFDPGRSAFDRLEAIAKRRFRYCRDRGITDGLGLAIDDCLKGAYRHARHLLADLRAAGPAPPAPPPPPPAPAPGEAFSVIGFQFEDRLTETFAAVGADAGAVVNLRLI